ncbi:MAG: hypothetical protein K9G76_06820 [Bacteroidales bacterium]|nr:hypothetical protein [Bacteroidales bacterium]MCF8404310.1 hypothetical protein [Bacteroidales bacterium]
MAKAKKFGAFAGVFTPSLLTILGVIMYMRLGWVVGNAGLVSTVIIILLAHVISLSTGLSVSSIATDKKIKAGGIYYILSRSLGLPMGGAIGITLFVGTALSISLYLVGFAENFLSIEPVAHFLGLEQNLMGYRVIGTAAILVLVAIAFISTSLAIKTQFYILGAIALSLVSIFVGFMLNTDLHPDAPLLNPINSEIDLAVIFAVFFPAVTGFTAGVAMSGDLKDPKKSIPLGTMASITVGLVIYVGLAVAIAFFVNRDLLTNDYNFLMKLAWFTPLVVAGIWGATLSSALGGILGGPRILQAMSSDKIGPKLFSKVYGVNNEPRVALIVIFIIAEAGILIGELNVIARVVSMFYLASYGFINIAYYLESWASTDFRPSFKISRYIGLVGFIAAFGVMFQLDVVSMFAALIIMMAIYFILKRKQIKLEYGDVWQSVWSTFMRTALDKMDKAEEVERNWRPNIMLFSGGTNRRPHLLNLGKDLVGLHGVLSNFDLIENKDARALFPKKNQSVPGEESAKGVFTRRQIVKDVYEGIDLISRTYGFSGLEPNTVMLGWARHTHDPVRFVEMLNNLYELDLNVVMLGYDKRVGFGKKKTIDIWFRDKSNHGNLALTLSKLLVMSDDWGQARIRVLIVNYLNERSEIIYKKMDDILDNMRIDAEIKVLNNQIERKPFYEIVEAESAVTDLVFLEIPDIKENEESKFVANTNILLERIGTVVLLDASSSFKKLKVGSGEVTEPIATKTKESETRPVKLKETILPEKPELAEACTHLLEKLDNLSKNYYKRTFKQIFDYRLNKTDLARQSVEKAYAVLENKSGKINSSSQIQLVSQLKTGLLIKLGKILEEMQTTVLSESQDTLETGITYLNSELDKIRKDIPEKVNIFLNREDLNPDSGDGMKVRLLKMNRRIFNKQKLLGQGIPYAVNFKEICNGILPGRKLGSAKESFFQFGNLNISFSFEFQKLLYAVTDAFQVIEKNIGQDNLQEIITLGKQNVFSHLDQLTSIIESSSVDIELQLNKEDNRCVHDISQAVSDYPANLLAQAQARKKIKEAGKELQSLPSKWGVNQSILTKSIHTELQLLLVEYRLYKIIEQSLFEINKILDEQVFMRLNQIQQSIAPKGKGEQEEEKISLPATNLQSQSLQLSLNKITDKAFRNIKSILRQLPANLEVFTEETINELTNRQFSDEETLKIPVLRLVDYFIQNELIAPLVSNTNKMAENIQGLQVIIEDAARLINLSRQNDKGTFVPEEDYENFGDIEAFTNDQRKKVDVNIEAIKTEFDTYKKNIRVLYTKTSAELHLFRLLKASENNKYLVRKDADKENRFIQTRLRIIRDFVQHQKANLWHSQSEARLLAKKVTDDQSKDVNLIDEMLNFKEKVSPKNGIIKKIPFYYQQLFLSQYNYQPEFWFGRQKELGLARKAINRYKAGIKGCLVITGDAKSGKSFFANYLVNENQKDHPTYIINPSGTGPAHPDTFLEHLKEATGMGGSVHEIMDKLPENSMMVLDDLELFWERSENGLVVIDSVFNLVRHYSDKVFFILVFNKRVFKLINQINPFGHFALQVVQLGPFGSKEIQEVILFRHRTSGLKLQIEKNTPGHISQAQYARLFNQVFNFSGGNIGAALLAWVTGISDFKNDTILLQSPRLPDTAVFTKLPKETKIYLLQFLLHKQLSVQKLCNVLLEEEIKVNYTVNYLRRAGIINEKAGGIFAIDKFLQVHIAKYLMTEFDKGN